MVNIQNMKMFLDFLEEMLKPKSKREITTYSNMYIYKVLPYCIDKGFIESVKDNKYKLTSKGKNLIKLISKALGEL